MKKWNIPSGLRKDSVINNVHPSKYTPLVSQHLISNKIFGWLIQEMTLEYLNTFEFDGYIWDWNVIDYHIISLKCLHFN